MVVAMKLLGIVALERFGEFVEELHEFSGSLIGQFDGQTHLQQIVGSQYDIQRF